METEQNKKSQLSKAWIWALANLPALFVAITVGELLSAALGYSDAGTATPLWVQLTVGVPTFAIVFAVSIYSVKVCLAAKKSVGNKAILPLIIALLALVQDIVMLIGSFVTISL